MKTDQIITNLKELSLTSPVSDYLALDRYISPKFNPGEHPYKSFWKFQDLKEALIDLLKHNPDWSRNIWATICEQFRSEQLRYHLADYYERSGPDFTQRNILIQQIFEGGKALDLPQIVAGNYYLGTCRNGKVAHWNGEEFHYVRTKFGQRFVESIEHPRNDKGFDLFVPFEAIEPFEHERLINENK